MTSSVLQPQSAADVSDIVADALRDGRRLEVRGGGSKAPIGAPREAAIVEMGELSGIVDYDPAELVLTAKAGTPLSEIEALVASEGQMLAFEPFDHGPILGRPAGAATIGGVVAAGVSGARRVSAGAARDHLLGFHAVSGRGERFVGGAKVVKNVTGYDLPKLAAHSWGRLFIMTEVTLKVLPRGKVATTLALEGLTASAAQAVLSVAMGSQADVQAAAHLTHDGRTLTGVRLEGFAPSVAARTQMLTALWRDHGAVEILETAQAASLWSAVAAVTPLDDGRPLWRVSTRPSRGPQVVAALAPLGAQWLFDWAGGVTWLSFDGYAAQVRAAAEAAEGHAMLVRAPEEMRRGVPALQSATAAGRRPGGEGAPRLRSERGLRDRPIPGCRPCRLGSRPPSSPTRRLPPLRL